jgi:hypothetical protein
MKGLTKGRKSGRARLSKLAQAMVRCATPDIYFAQNDGWQQINLPLSDSSQYASIAPEQIYALARIKTKIS